MILFFVSHSAPPNISCPSLLSIIFSSSYIYCTIVRKIRDVICEVERASCQNLVFFFSTKCHQACLLSPHVVNGEIKWADLSHTISLRHMIEKLFDNLTCTCFHFLSRTTISGQFLRSFMQTSLAVRYFKESPPVLQLGRNRMMKMATRTMNR